MKPLWLGVALCLIALAATAHSAAVPAKDEYVVFARNNRKSRTVSTDETTEKPLVPVKLTEMRVHSEVALRYARTSVITHVTNPDSRPQEATFRMLLPDTAFISGFTMILSGKSYKAYVKEKEEAKQIYTQAVSQGLGAAHVATKARDSNHFTVSVNVEGNTTAIFDLRYEEFLVRRNGLYNHAINLHPGAFVPKMEVVVHIKESQKITKLHVPEVRTGNEIDATEKDPQNSIAVIKRGTKEKEVTITFTPDETEQRRLAAIYVDKTKEKSSSERYIGYSSDEDEQEPEDGKALGQFVVQYDVERPSTGEVLVNDGYFVHFVAPTGLTPLNKDVKFVVDTSGSMMGRKIDQLIEAMKIILSNLNENDYFNIVEFNSDVTVHDLKEADEEPPPRYHHYSYYNNRNKPLTLVPASRATPENIAKAKVVVSRLFASGGTNIYSALEVALKLVKNRDQKANATDSKSTAATTVATTTVAKPEDSKIKEELEPIIIFLTDGDPTVGETNPNRINSFVTETNTGENAAVIYSLAFGEDAERSFLRKLALRNNGFMRHIYEAADAALQLRDFYRQISSPLLSHVMFQYPEKQIKEGSVSRTQFRTINEGSEVAVVGKLSEEATEITPQVSGFCGDADGVGRKRYQVSTKAVVNRTKDDYLPLERLWAYLTIKQLLDKRDAGDEDDTSVDDANSPEKKALAIALKYEFVTSLTSLVVVKPEESNAVDVESVDKLAQDSLGGAFIPLSGPPSAVQPNNAYLTSGFASIAALPGLAGPPPPFYQSGHIQPLALDAVHYSDILAEDEVDTDYSNPTRTVALFTSSSSRRRFSPTRTYYDPTQPLRNVGVKGDRPAFSSGFPGLATVDDNDMQSFISFGQETIVTIGGSGSPQARGEKGDNTWAGGIFADRIAVRPSGYSHAGHGSYGSAGGLSGWSGGGWSGGSGGGGGGGGFAGLPSPPQRPQYFEKGYQPTTTPYLFPSYATTPLYVQAPHGLQQYIWTISLLNDAKDSLVLDVNGTEVILKLSNDDDPPKADGGDSECSNGNAPVGPDGAADSACVYLTRCPSARGITAEDYQKSYCIVNNEYAGVCCARSDIKN